MHKVYLIRNGSGRPIYIGLTSNEKVRLMAHKRKYGRKCTMEVLFVYESREEAVNKEKEMIVFYASQMKMKNRNCTSLDKRIPLVLYISTSIVESAGGREGAKRIAEQAISRCAKLILKKR